jgi:hypothetical protein
MSKHTLGSLTAKIHLRGIQRRTLDKIIDALANRVKVTHIDVWPLDPSSNGVWAKLSVDYTTIAHGNYASDIRKVFHEAFQKVKNTPEFWFDEVTRQVWEELGKK